MIAFLARAFLFYCFYIFIKGFFSGLKEEKSKKNKPIDKNVVEAKFRRLD
jgi:hypothetical protein